MASVLLSGTVSPHSWQTATVTAIIVESPSWNLVAIILASLYGISYTVRQILSNEASSAFFSHPQYLARQLEISSPPNLPVSFALLVAAFVVSLSSMPNNRSQVLVGLPESSYDDIAER